MKTIIKSIIITIIIIASVSACTPETLLDYDYNLETKATEGDQEEDKSRPGM